MMKQLKKVLSILCAIALLISSMAFALAEDIDNEETDNITIQQNDDQPADDPAEVTAVTADDEDEDEQPVTPAASNVSAADAEEETEQLNAPAADAGKEDEQPADPSADADDEDELLTQDDGNDDEIEPAEGEAFNTDEEESGEDEESESEGLSHPAQEAVEENASDITDEMIILRDAELYVDDTLDDTIRFSEELTVTLKDCDVSAVELLLYLPAGASVITKVDGKLVSFTPAASDVPSMKLCTYELANAAGRNHEIVLSTYDEEVPFSLAAVAKRVEEVTEEEPVNEEEVIPAAENNAEAPAGETANETPTDAIPVNEASDDETPVETESEAPAEKPAPTIQTSVKTYTLNIGRSISDALITAQKAKVQIKCGKTPYITLTLTADIDDVNVTIDGQTAWFTDEGDGTYTCDLDEVAFRKFTVMVAAKKELSFTLSAEARQVEGAPVYEDEEDNEDEDTVDEYINIEETDEESADEVTEEAENTEETEETVETEEAEETETAEETAEEDAGETEEASEEVTEETEEEAAEETEVAETPEETEGEEAEGEAENTEEETAEEAVTAEPLTDDQLIELGYRKVQVLNGNGADIYTGIEEAEAIGHADFESELWIRDAEAEGWAEIYNEEETRLFVKLAELDKQPLTEEEIEALGYRKVQILNQNGTDIYDSTEEEAAVIGHADFESELWIKDLETKGWAEIFSEKETKQYVKLAELDKQSLTDEELIELGYRKVQVLNGDGVDLYDSTEEEANIIDHIDCENEIWIKDTEVEGWAEIYNKEENVEFVKIEDIDKLTDEQMLALGYIKVYVAIDIGANVYAVPVAFEEEEPINHLDAGTELWVKLVDDATRATIYNKDEKANPAYINLVDIIATLKPEGMEDLPARSIKMTSNLEGFKKVFYGMREELTVTLENFEEDDQYSVTWYTSSDKGETFTELEGVDGLSYRYKIDEANAHNIWKVVILLTPQEE